MKKFDDILEIDCRKCGNCDMEHGCCLKYGKDPTLAAKQCADHGFTNYKPVRNVDPA